MGEKIYNDLKALLKEKMSFIDEQIEKENKKNLEWIKLKYLRLLDFLETMKGLIDCEQKMGLILLGYLVSVVAYEQGLKNKPILKKIKYSGMNIKDIVRFSNVISEKMVQLKIISYNDLSLYLKNKLLTPEIDRWKLSKDENVFYLMSGYSVGAVFRKSKEDKEKELENSDEMVENS